MLDRCAPARRPAVADGQPGRPADEGDPPVTPPHEVIDDRADAGHVVDVDQGCRRSLAEPVCPNVANGTFRSSSAAGRGSSAATS